MALFLRSSCRFWLVVASLALTWGLVFVAAAQQPGYDHLRDSISALASRSAQLPWIGAMAIAFGGIATLAASFALRRVSQPAALSLALAGVALLIVAVTPIRCVGGSAGCEMFPGGSNWISKTHLAAVGFYEFASVAAAMSAGVALLRRGARRTAVVCVVGAVLSLLLFSAAPVALGLMQRAWLLVHSALLVGVPYLAVSASDGSAAAGIGFSGERPGAAGSTPVEGHPAKSATHSGAGSSHRHRVSHRRSVPD